jgi:hypothetical protein
MENEQKNKAAKKQETSEQSWTTLEEDYIAFLLPAQKCTKYIKQVLMLELSKTNS